LIMKQSHQSVAMAGLLAVVLAASGCAATGSAGDMASSATSSHTDDVASSSGDVERIVTTGSGSAGMQDERSDQSAATSARMPAPNGTVLSIASLPVPGGMSKSDASVGTSGTAGATGGTGAAQAYRVQVRMDDGSTQVITYSGTSDLRSGERVNVTGGAIRR
jgi:hypothetical protein